MRASIKVLLSSVLLLPTVMLAADAGIYQLEDSEHGKVLKSPEGQVVFQYMTKKPANSKLSANSVCCLYPLNTPSGEGVVDFAPSDHPHHRGLFLAWHSITGKEKADFWGWGEWAPTKGRVIKNRSVKLLEADGEQAKLEIHNDWMVDNKKMIAEQTFITAWRKDKANLLELVYQLTPTEDITLDQTAFGGFCAKVRKDGTGTYSCPKGKAELKPPHHLKPETDWPSEKWYDYTTQLNNGKTVGIAILDHPANPKTTWHNLGAISMVNPCIVAPGAVPIKKGESLTLRYGLVVHDGSASTAQLNRYSQLWQDQDETVNPVFPESKEQRDARMKWFRNGRFGMFIHWGLYAVPAGTWKGKQIPGIGEWIMHRGQIPVEDYKPLAKQFNPVKFNAKEWVTIAKNTGMKYIVITSKHHDGFCLWDSKYTEYDIMDATPFGRDILRELSDECHRQGIQMCFYHSIMDWQHPDYLPRRKWDKRSAEGADLRRYINYMKNQLRELVDKYGPLGILWFDGEWENTWTAELGDELEIYCRRLQKEIILNNRVGKRQREDGDYGTPEQFIPSTGIPGHDWETCMTMNDTWGFKSYDHNWKSKEDLIQKLIDIASKGGNFLLNVGPTAEGLIPAPSVERLAAMGEWMKVNRASIYGTSASVFRYLPWGRSTTKGKKLYLHVFDWTSDGKLSVPGLLSEVSQAYLLADKKSLPVEKVEGDVVVSVPTAAPDPIASVIVLEVAGRVRVDTIIRPRRDGSIVLLARDADCQGEKVEYHVGHGTRLGDYIHHWSEKDDTVSWRFQSKEKATYNVEITYASPTEGGEFQVMIGKRKIAATIKKTGGGNDFKKDVIGSMKINRPGKRKVTIQPIKITGDGLMHLKSLKLIPQK